MSTSAVEKEILKVVKVKAKAKEARQEFLERVTAAVADLSDDDWNSLSDVAQNWCNDATAAANAEDEIPEFPEGDAKPAKKAAKASKKAEVEEADEEEADEEEADEEAEEEAEEGEESDEDEDGEEEYEESEEDEDQEEEEEKPKASKKAAKEKEAKPVKEKAAKPAKEEGKVSGVTRVRELTLENPDMKAEEIDKIIRKEGYDVSEATVKANHADVHKTLKIMARLGIFDIKA